MKNNTSEENKLQHVEEIAVQMESALTSNKTPEPVKDCLKTIFNEAAEEADIALDDLTEVRAHLPKIIEKLGADYGRGFLHSIAAILRHDTDTFADYSNQQPVDKKLSKSSSKQSKDNDIELGEVSIWKTGSDGNETARIALQIPYYFSLGGHRDLARYKSDCIEELRIKIGTIFELNEFLGQLLSTGDYKSSTLAEFILTLGSIGVGLADAMEVVENSFERYMKNNATEVQQ